MMSPISEEGSPLIPSKPPSAPSTPSRRWAALSPPERLVATAEAGTFAAMATRWYILALFFVLTANQCLFWFTFSSNPTEVSAYYGISDGEIDQLLNWGPITFVLAVPFVSFMLTRKDGLRRVMRLAAVLCASACLIRLIPCFLTDKQRRGTWAGRLPLHIAQILNGIAGPVLIAAPSRLSAIWFPPELRARVTAIANSSLFGAAIGFYLGPAVADIRTLLIITAALSAVPLLATFAYCPAAPQRAPSAAVVIDDEPIGGWAFVTGAARTVAERPSMLLLMVVTGAGVGVYDAWIGVLPQILDNVSNATSAHRDPWDQAMNGTCGMVHTGACIVGMWCAGALADRAFQRRYKALLMLLFILATALFFWVICMLDGGVVPFGDAVPRTTPLVFASVALVGFVRSAAVPVLYESAAELTYPLPEGTSAGLVVIAEHLTLLSLLFAVPHMSLRLVNLLCLCCLGACPLMLIPFRSRYLRLDAEDAIYRKATYEDISS
mmetsp:Transcript_19946/g.59669  ORF Transcript_19946/g.59669 Transcript_19946/m.59669 type:complete len:494 (-) Transcript_19946:57-1538(-)